MFECETRVFAMYRCVVRTLEGSFWCLNTIKSPVFRDISLEGFRNNNNWIVLNVLRITKSHL